MTRYLQLPCFLLLVFVLNVVLCRSAAAQGQAKVPERSQIDAKYTWDLSDLYADRSAWEADFKACEQEVAGLAKSKGTVAKSPAALLGYLTLYDELSVKFSKVAVYASLLRDQDTRQAEPQAMYDRAMTLNVKLDEATAWFQPEILELPGGQLLDWCKKTPKLTVYTHYFENVLRQKPHVLSTREEELMAMTGRLAATPRETFSMLADADMKYATSFAASVALSKGVLSGDPRALNSYFGFLKAGSSGYPIEILKKAGVDMSTPKPIQDTMDLFAQMLDELERLLKVK